MTNDSQLPTQIETDRLILRGYQPDDSPMYYRISQKNKSHLNRFETSNAILSIQSEKDAEAVIQDFINCWTSRKAFFLGAFLKGTDIYPKVPSGGQEFVAQIYIGVVNWELPEFEIGYFVDASHEGKGYVSEAVKGVVKFLFIEMGAHRIRLECDETNLRSIHVAERCGFIREGLIRETKKHADGTCTGDVHYGMLRNEFVPS